MTEENSDANQEKQKEEAKQYIRHSQMAWMIIKKLAEEGEPQRPGELFEEISQEIGGTESNFYNFLGQLEGTAVNKEDKPGRTKLYELTDLGWEIAEEENLLPGKKIEKVTITSDDSLTKAVKKIKDVLDEDLEDIENTAIALQTKQLKTSQQSQGEAKTRRER